MMDMSKFSEADLQALASGNMQGLSDTALQSLANHQSIADQIENDPITQGARNFNKDSSWGKNFVAGYGGALPKLAAGVQQMLTFDKDKSKQLSDQEAERRRLDAPLEQSSGGFWGSIAGTIAPALPAMFLPGANTVTGAGVSGALSAAFEPRTEDESRLGHAAVGAALGSGVQKVLEKGAYALANRAYNAETQKSLNALRDAALAKAQAAGYVVPPSSVGGGKLNNILESLGGKAALKQDIVNRNQAVTNKLGRGAVGLADDAPITTSALRDVRESAGNAGYDPIDQIEQLNWTPEYVQALDSISQRLGGAGSNVRALQNPAVSEMVADLNQPSFTGPEVNALIKKLRESGNRKANGIYGSAGGDAERTLGKSMLEGSGALEDLVSANLQTQGRNDLIPALLEARRQIAKSHTVEKALNVATGDVDPKVLAALFKKQKPLSDGLDTIGEFTAAFPEFSKLNPGASQGGVAATVPAASGLMGMLGHMVGGAKGAVLGTAIPWMRGVPRSMVLSKPYQQMMAKPTYAGNSLLGMTPGRLSNPRLQMAARTLPMGALQTLGYDE